MVSKIVICISIDSRCLGLFTDWLFLENISKNSTKSADEKHIFSKEGVITPTPLLENKGQSRTQTPAIVTQLLKKDAQPCENKETLMGIGYFQSVVHPKTFLSDPKLKKGVMSESLLRLVVNEFGSQTDLKNIKGFPKLGKWCPQKRNPFFS